MTDDAHLDATSRQLLTQLDDIKRLEQEKRAEARSTEQFHDLAEEISDKSSGRLGARRARGNGRSDRLPGA